MGTKITTFEENVLETIYTENVFELRELLKYADVDCGKALSTPLPYDEHGRSLLHLAAWADNYEQISSMLEKDPDVNIQDYYGWTPLMVCLYKGNIQSAYALLQKSAQFDANSKEAKWLLQHAVRHDLMLKNTEKSTNLLNIAVDNENVAMTRLLLEKGQCDPNVIDSAGFAPIHLACGHGNLSLFKVLTEFGADVNLKDKNGNTPLAWARQYGSTRIKAELEKLNAVADEKWHEDEKKSNEYPVDIDVDTFYTANEAAEDPEETQEQYDPDEQEEETFEEYAEEYIDEYRNEMWSEVNQEIEAIALSEDDTVHGENKGKYIDTHVENIEVGSMPYNTNLPKKEKPQLDQTAEGNPHQEDKASCKKTENSEVKETKNVVNLGKDRADEYSDQPARNIGSHIEDNAGDSAPTAAEMTKSAEENTGDSAPTAAENIKTDDEIVGGKADYTDDTASASSKETTHFDMKTDVEDMDRVGKDRTDDVLTDVVVAGQ